MAPYMKRADRNIFDGTVTRRNQAGKPEVAKTTWARARLRIKPLLAVQAKQAT